MPASVRLLAVALATTLAGPAAQAIDCSQSSVGRTPIDDLGSGTYLGAFEGGLYPDGSNGPPPGTWRADGLARAAAIRPLDAEGDPDPGGAVILACMGMSNAAQEFGTEANGILKFAQRAKLDPETHPRLHLINGCLSSGTTVQWSNPDGEWWDHFRTQPSVQVPGFEGSLEQVQAIWFKVAVAHPGRTYPTLPSPDAHAYAHARQIYDALRVVAQQVPNLQLLFLSTRTYGGYIDPSGDLSPEPYPYESGFSVKWIVESQIREVATGVVDPLGLGIGSMDYRTGVVPWIAWGPYLWADGATPRSDGLTWDCDAQCTNGNCGDFEIDGVHPSRWGEQKVSTQLLAFMKTSPLSTPWFLAAPEPAAGASSAVALAALRWLCRARASRPRARRLGSRPARKRDGRAESGVERWNPGSGTT